VYQWNMPASTTSVYFDGAFIGQNTNQATVRATTAPFRMVGNSSSHMFYNGAIDEVSVASAVRSSQWIATHYANGAGTLTILGDIELI
jgi:hypothetical protein